MRQRSVFLTLPFDDTRTPIADVVARAGGGVEVRPVPHQLDPNLPAAGMVAAVLTDLGQLAGEGALMDRIPESCGPHIAWGEVVRVRYDDGTHEDIDERQVVAGCPVEDPRLPGETNDEAKNAAVPWTINGPINPSTAGDGGSYAQFCGPGRLRPHLHLSIASEWRGCTVLVEPRDGGPTWERAHVESWEEETKRLRRGVAHLGASMRGWAKNERDLSKQPPSAEKADVHYADKMGGANALWNVANRIDRLLAPASRRR